MGNLRETHKAVTRLQQEVHEAEEGGSSGTSHQGASGGNGGARSPQAQEQGRRPDSVSGERVSFTKMSILKGRLSSKMKF